MAKGAISLGGSALAQGASTGRFPGTTNTGIFGLPVDPLTGGVVGALGLGGSKKGSGSSGPRLTNFNAVSPGLSLASGLTGDGTTFGGGLTRLGSPEQTAFDERFPRVLSDIDTLRESLTPGFSALRDARLQEVENARTSAIGNLRDNLARRKVEGSSFAGNALARAERGFAQEAASQAAQAFLEETAANQAVLQQEQETVAFGIERELQELGLAAGFVQGTGALFLQNEQIANQLATDQANNSAQGKGALTGSALRLAGNKNKGRAVPALSSGAGSGGFRGFSSPGFVPGGASF